MKRILLRLNWSLVFAFLLFLGLPGFSQVLLTENFDYANGTLLTAAGWTAHSGSGTQAVDVIVPGLTFAGYPLSNIGGAAQLDNTGEDVNKVFAAQSSGAVYVSFMVKIDALGAAYFLHLGQTSMGSTYFGRVSLAAGTGNNFKFGLAKSSETVVNYSSEFVFGTTYLVVLKYNIIDGTANDEVSLYIISGTVPAAEPATASIPAFTTSATDYSPGSVGLRQFEATQRIYVDGIRIGKTWTDAVTASAGSDISAPVFTSGYPKVSNINSTQADLQVNLDEAGKAYYVVVADGKTAPTAAQVFAGVDYGSVTLIKNGNIAVTTGGSVVSATITGLTDKTNYDIYVVAQDDEPTPNKQTAPVLVDLYTIRPADVIVNADFNTTLAPFTQVSLTGDAVWDMYTISTENKCAKMSGYVGTTYFENLDYLISPQINLDASDQNKISFISAKNYTGLAMKVLISTNFSGTYTPTGVSAATWTDITSNFTYSTGSFTFVASGEFSLSAFSGKAYIAFVFESNTSQSATWEVDNFLVTGYKKETGTEDLMKGQITLYPVPADNKICFGHIQGVSTIDVFDMQGRKYLTQINNNFDSGHMNVSRLPAGIYMIRFSKAGGQVVMKFIKK
jgi:hypothetical protein